jgi:hypothetical protein
MNVWKRLIFLVAVSALLVLSACGGDSSSSQSTPSEGQPESSRLSSFGQEAGSDEREAASRVLEENLRARAAEDWPAQCASLSASLTKEIVERAELITAKKGAGSCAKGLELEAEPVPASVLKDPMTGPIDALRVEGKKAYALFHGAGNMGYAMPMVEEGGRWKVGQLTTIELGKS